jgi:8-oxo-dGTP pyrophosphatase MutT (NUDIX family)
VAQTPPAYSFELGLRDCICRHLDAFDARELHNPRLRRAAVALTVVGVDHGEACFVLTVRRGTLRRHAGQYALPGGRMDPGETPEAAARRELAEEVGLLLPHEAVLGRLDDYETRSGHLITPVVLWGTEDPCLAPNPTEVAAVRLVPLAHLDRTGNPRLTRIAESDRPVISLSLLDTLVFAPTAAALYQFREVALHGRHVRVAHLEQPVFAWR